MTLQEELAKILLKHGKYSEVLIRDLTILALEHEKARMIEDYEMYKSSLTKKG